MGNYLQENFRQILFLFVLGILLSATTINAQSRKLTPANIDSAIVASSSKINADSMRPAFHLVPPAGSMGDPNGGIYHNGWFHIFYGLYPFAHHPGGWYWAHARSKDLLHWEHMEPGLTPPFELGLTAIGSGSTIITKEGRKLAFYSQSRKDEMEFWRAEFADSLLSEWVHTDKNPILTLDYPGLPPFDKFWRDPFVFTVDGRTFLIACADLFEEDYVPVPIFEAKNKELTEWDYKGNLFTVPKHKFRNLEVPEFRPLGDKWIFIASSDAPTDRVNYFLGEFDIDNLQFLPEEEGPIDFSGHYYAQETIPGENGSLYLMAWMPGWDRDWLPLYMNDPLKNSDKLWNGIFALPRKLTLQNGELIQQPVSVLEQLRTQHFQLGSMELPVSGPFTAIHMLQKFRGNQVEINLEMDLHHASFCGINVLADDEGIGGLPIVWSGNKLQVDDVEVPIEEWKPGNPAQLQIFVDKKFVEIFVNGGRYSVSRQVREENVKGDRISLTSLGGTCKFASLEAWHLKSINIDNERIYE